MSALDDIDEDPVPPPTMAPTGKKAANAPDLDDIFGGLGVTAKPTAPVAQATPVAAPAPAAAPKKPTDALDDFFSPSAPAAQTSSTGSTRTASPQPSGDLLGGTSGPSTRHAHGNADDLMAAMGSQLRTGGRSGHHTATLADFVDQKLYIPNAPMLAMMDHYEVLGLAKTVTPEEISRAYRKLALQLHPDKRGGRERTHEEEEYFKTITKAHEVLADEQQRAAYDKEIKGQKAVPAGAEWLAHVA